jgi:hypothetical protein
MPDCMLGYKPGKGRRELVAALIKDLPDIIVSALREGAGMQVDRTKLIIPIVAWDPESYNVPDLQITVMTGRGAGDRTYNSRERVRIRLRAGVHQWLEAHPKLRTAAEIDDGEAIVRFAESCGVNFDANTGVPRSMWGGLRDN